jgi:sporulation protein YlmC with PRC-barrel domain
LTCNATEEGRTIVKLYGILRRNGWATGEDLEVAGKRSAEVGDKDGSGVRWIRSYVLAEESGEVGTFCVYEGESPEAIRAHADEAGLPADEIIPIADTVIVRPDPAPVGA